MPRTPCIRIAFVSAAFAAVACSSGSAILAADDAPQQATGAPAIQAAPWFRKADKDGDGKLSRAEFWNAELFSKVDTDQDGFATPTELQDYYTKNPPRKKQLGSPKKGAGEPARPAGAEPTQAATNPDTANQDDVEKRPVVIWSDGTRMAGDVYLPKNRQPGEKLPGIVFCAGTGGTKKGLPTRLGPILARAGFVCLGFDYRGWGESEARVLPTGPISAPSPSGEVTVTGKPIRWQMNLMDQTFDIRAAISYLQGEPEVDPERIGLFGSSYGGGLVTLMAAIDPRVKCVAAQVGGLGIGPAADKLGFDLLRQQARGETEPVPIETGKLGGKLSGYEQMRRNPARSVGFGEKYEVVGRIRIPMIFVDAENEELLNTKENGEKFTSILKANGVPVEYHVIKGISHYGIYGKGFEEATKLELAWFTRYLKGEAAAVSSAAASAKQTAPPAEAKIDPKLLTNNSGTLSLGEYRKIEPPRLKKKAEPSAKAGTPPAPPALATHVAGLFQQHCQRCHGKEKAEGELRLDRIEADFTNPDTVQQWQFIQERLRDGEMPPKGEPRPDAEQAAAVMRWIDTRLLEAAERRQAEGRTVLRRLNRIEYENTVHDLLGVDVALKDTLPEDPVAFGFDNVATAQNISPVQMERYLEAADRALDEVVVAGPRPETTTQRFQFVDSVPPFYKKFAPRHEQALLVFRVKELILNGPVLEKYKTPSAGVYKFRILMYAHRSPDKPIVMTALVGNFGNFGVGGGMSQLVGYYEVPPGEPKIVEIVARIQAAGDTIKFYPADIPKVSLPKPAEYSKSPCLAVEWIEVEGPLHPEWPPPSHRRLFGDLDLTLGTLADAERVLRQFLPRAFRRSISEDDMQPYLKLVEAALKEGQPFEQAIRAGLKMVLCSPRFLFLREKPGKLDDFALASRLSYFLWNSMPDEELLEAAQHGGLSQPDVLHSQVERLLGSPRAAAFTENFLGQWLNLRQINFTTPDTQLYPEFDDFLGWSMVRETHLFFEELLRNDLSLLNLVDSDFSMLNERVARHYGISGVEGLEFQKVALKPEYHRGGLLTQGSVLKVSANGTTTSPVIRGVWVLNRILGKPPKPPPADVPAVEPDIRGAVTIREQLAKHREVDTCASCHKQIDPLGYALENYDAIGGWREHYRTLGTESSLDLIVNNDRVAYSEGSVVESDGVLADGRTFANLDGLKKLLLENPDQIARALAEKLVVYATGHGMEYGDREVVERIVAQTREQKYGLRALVHAVVQSELFLDK